MLTILENYMCKKYLIFTCPLNIWVDMWLFRCWIILAVVGPPGIRPSFWLAIKFGRTIGAWNAKCLSSSLPCSRKCTRNFMLIPGRSSLLRLLNKMSEAAITLRKDLFYWSLPIRASASKLVMTTEGFSNFYMNIFHNKSIHHNQIEEQFINPSILLHKCWHMSLFIIGYRILYQRPIYTSNILHDDSLKT